MRKLIASLLVLVAAVVANAGVVTYGWEDGGVVLGTFDNGGTIAVSNSTEQSYSGVASLKFIETTPDSAGTPQAYVGWVTGLSEGDIVTASFWVYDISSSFPSARIWGGYSSGTDINAYVASAGGSNTYSGTSTWSMLEYTWTVGAGYEALVIQARMYGSASTDDIVYIDDITISCSNDNAVIHTAVVPEPATMILLGLGGLLFARKK